MEQQMRCEIISWRRVEQLCRILFRAIRRGGFKPDAIVTIARGGYVPARLLCDYFDITALSSIRVEHYVGARKKKLARLVEPLGIAIQGLNILLVDDVSDTGDTLELAIRHLGGFGPREIRTAVLHHKTVSTVIPDYYAQRIVKWRWIIYPWAVQEDISGFLAGLEKRPASAAEAGRILAERYGLRIAERLLREIMSATTPGQRAVG
ncbi:MAG: phosphoribosyltransferase [Deltaproteobacteria bacterium RIFOXYD12_FULL_57_12]|nr:MAG: phosphoribosyltransferase [Deltaproteobacteria bacterium RIFOXYD12_FULL_57_12]